MIIVKALKHAVEFGKGKPLSLRTCFVKGLKMSMN